jgi:dihydroorotate dehydrogenase (NAD+) catalytic subunit
MPADLRTRLAHVELPSPVLTAAGCAGSGRELAQFIDVARIGAVITKSVTLEPRAGNPVPRLAETPSGMLSAAGLQGPGIDAFLQRDLPWLLSRGARAVVSIAGHTAREYAELATRLSDAAGVTAIEVNLGCPDAERGAGPDRLFAHDAASAGKVVAAVRGSARWDIPVFAKLSPDVTDIVAVARACVTAGADGLSMINTLPGMAVDATAMRPTLAAAVGGLSGPALKPVAVRCVWQVREAFPDVPLIGAGGVRTGTDALELMLAGAAMIAVGTVLFHDPSACARIQRELEEELVARGIDRVADIIGRAHQPAGFAADRHSSMSLCASYTPIRLQGEAQRDRESPARERARERAGNPVQGNPVRERARQPVRQPVRQEGGRRAQAGPGGRGARRAGPGDRGALGGARDAARVDGQNRTRALPALRPGRRGLGARRERRQGVP